MRAKPPDRKTPDPRAQARKAALNALKKARRMADKGGVELSDWEGEFLGSVAQRIETYGRAFGDPEKGGAGQAQREHSEEGPRPARQTPPRRRCRGGKGGRRLAGRPWRLRQLFHLPESDLPRTGAI